MTIFINILFYLNRILYITALYQSTANDLKYRKIPNLYPGIICIAGILDFWRLCLADTVSLSSLLADRLLGAIVISIPLLILALIYGSFGGGDIKLSGACGLFLGVNAALKGFAVAIFSAGIFILFLLIGKRIKTKDQIALGPFLSLGFLVGLLF